MRPVRGLGRGRALREKGPLMSRRATICLTLVLTLPPAGGGPVTATAVQSGAGAGAQGPRLATNPKAVRGEFAAVPIRSIIDSAPRPEGARTWLSDTSVSPLNVPSVPAAATDAVLDSAGEPPDTPGRGEGNQATQADPSSKRTNTSTILLPEPATAAFLIVGAGGLLVLRRHRPKA